MLLTQTLHATFVAQLFSANLMATVSLSSPSLMDVIQHLAIKVCHYISESWTLRRNPHFALSRNYSNQCIQTRQLRFGLDKPSKDKS